MGQAQQALVCLLPGVFYNTNTMCIDITVSALPFGGNCTITPDTGEALSTVFRVFCFNWSNDARDTGYLQYLFHSNVIANTSDSSKICI